MNQRINTAKIWIASIYLLLISAIPILSSCSDNKQAAPKAPHYEITPIDKVDGALRKLEFGNIAFNAPTSVKIQDTADIQLILSLAIPQDELKKMIMAEGAVNSARTQVSDRMQAHLSSSGFTITAVSPEVQAVSRQEATKWEWNIKPNSEGKQHLNLTLSALLNIDGESTPRVIQTFDKTIEVTIPPKSEIFTFLKENWQWLWTTIFIPLGAWLLRKKQALQKNALPEEK